MSTSTLTDLIELRTVYDKATKKAGKGLRKEIGRYLAEHLPENTAMEWTQGDGVIERFETEAVRLTNGGDSSYCLEDGAEGYDNTIPGVGKKTIRTLLKAWHELPLDLLDTAFGDATVIVQANGKVIVR